MITRVSCSHCHTMALAGTCPSCGHDNDRPRTDCICIFCQIARNSPFTRAEVTR